MIKLRDENSKLKDIPLDPHQQRSHLYLAFKGVLKQGCRVAIWGGAEGQIVNLR